MHLLDDVDYCRMIDMQDMLKHIRSLPTQVETAWSQVHEVDNLPTERPSDIVILGMGGSAIGGDIACSLAYGFSEIPMVVHRDYGIPRWVGSSSLVIAVSHSGNTEETLSGFEEACKRGSMLFAIASGGKLIEMAEKHGVPFYRYESEAPPRASIGYLLMPILAVLSSTGVYKLDDEVVSNAVDCLNRLKQSVDAEVPTEDNKAKQLAVYLHGHIGLILASHPLTAVARRWKTQINENANTACFFEVLPELCHNTVVGLDFPCKLSDVIRVLMLRSAFSNDRNRLREEIVNRLLKHSGIKCEQVEVEVSAHPLCEALQLVMLGDFVSYYLSLLNRVNPTTILNIDYLKLKLSQA